MYSKILAIALAAIFCLSHAPAQAAYQAGGSDGLASLAIAIGISDDVCGKLNKKSIWEDHTITQTCEPGDEVICYCDRTTDWSNSKYKNCSTEDDENKDLITVYCTCNDEGTAYSCPSVVSSQ